VTIIVLCRYGTFLKRWNSKWTSVLKFRTASEFSQCDQCQELKAQFLGLLSFYFYLVLVGLKRKLHTAQVPGQAVAHGVTAQCAETVSCTFDVTVC
jgi:hypothetical protein